LLDWRPLKSPMAVYLDVVSGTIATKFGKIILDDYINTVSR